MASPHSWNKIQSPSQGSLQEPAWLSTSIPASLPLPHSLPAVPPTCQLSQLPASELTVVPTWNCPSQPSPPGSLRDWTHLLQEVFPDRSMKTALQSPTLLALSLLFPVFNFRLCNYYYLKLHRVFIIITFYYLSAPLKCELHERRGFSLLKQSLTLVSPHYLKNEISRLGEIINPNEIHSNTLSPTSPSLGLPQVSLTAAKAHILYLNPRVMDRG